VRHAGANPSGRTVDVNERTSSRSAVFDLLRFVPLERCGPNSRGGALLVLGCREHFLLATWREHHTQAPGCRGASQTSFVQREKQAMSEALPPAIFFVG
jgi:hypothetical protein